MRLLLIVALLGFPLAEAFVLVRLTQAVGWWMLAWVMISALAGVALIKEARFAMVARLAAGLPHGRFSISALTDSARTVLAGLLLIFPGVISDLVALVLLLWPSPRVVVEPVMRRGAHGTILEGEFRRSR